MTMPRKLVALIGAILCCSMPGYSQDFYEAVSASRYTGVYLTVPFGGGRRNDQNWRDHMQFGLVSGYRVSNKILPVNDWSFQRREHRLMPMFHIQLNESGLEGLSLAGLKVASKGPDGRLHLLNADGDGDTEEISTGKVFLIGTAVVASVFVLGFTGACIQDAVSDDERDWDFCPL